MLFCKKCQVDYEGEMRFCPQCGSFLVRKEAAFADPGTSENSEEDKPKEKYICPDCKIIYEKSKSCIRCRTEVVPLSSFQLKGKTESVQDTETGKESFDEVLTTREWLESSPELLVCPACKKEHLGGKSCIRCGTVLVPLTSPPIEEKTKKTQPPGVKTSEPKASPVTETATDLFEDETPDAKTSKLSVQEQIKKGRLVRKIKKDYPRTALNWSGIAIICIAIGYFLYSTYSHIILPGSDSAPPPSQERGAAPVTSSFAIPPSQASLTEKEEIEKIKGLLENIRWANLTKDISLFISCYSRDFKDREGKKRTTLQSWEDFNFLDLTYTLGTYSFSENSVRARVEWWARFSSKRAALPQESKNILDVVFKKEDGDWKIGEIKSSL